MKYLNTRYRLFESEISDVIEKCKIYKIEKYEIDDDGLITVYGDVKFSNYKQLLKLPLNFKEIYGNFVVSGANIECMYGAPKYVHKNYIFEFTKIRNLNFCPIEVGGAFHINNNYYLNNIKNFPNLVGCGVNMMSCDLKSLYGCIDNINGYFYIDTNNLINLKYGPKHVDGEYVCKLCNLKSLYGAPKHVSGFFDCSYNNLTSLKYSPEYIGGDFYFMNNNIYTLYNFPNHVGGEIYCENTHVYKIWELFEDKNYIEYFNQMKIIKNDTVNINKLNLFLKSIGKEPVRYVKGYVNI